MANRQTTFLIKRSNVPGKIPPSSGLTSGELALNTADAILYTSGSTANQILPIGWDRIHRTGDTVFGDFAISGSSLPSGYALSVTGDTNFAGDIYVQGDLNYDGNLIVSGGTIVESGFTANTIYTDYIDFNTSATVAQSVGRINWDSGTGTLNVNVGDSGTGLIDLQVGQEEIVRVFNDEATTLVKGEIVYVSGSQGNRPKVKRALATSDGYSVTTLGMVDRNITSGAEGYVTTFGIISNLNTLGLSGGTPIWLSPTTPGGYTSTKPQAPNHTVLIGYVVRVSATVGSIFVNISNGWELDEIHDVRISAATEGDLLMKSSFSGTPVWVNTKTLNGSYTITGNTNIGGNLTVSGNSGTSWFSSNTSSDLVRITQTGSGNAFVVEDNTNPDTSPFVIDASGNTGIGTTTPSYKLHISGDTFIDPSYYLRTKNITAGDSQQIIYLRRSDGSVNNSLFLDSNTLRIKTQGTLDAINVFNSGRVGILQTTDAGYTLDVNGTLRVTGNTSAVSGITTGGLISNTLISTANNDELVGLDITPTFTNGSFTGVTNLGLRVKSLQSSIGNFVQGTNDVLTNDILSIRGTNVVNLFATVNNNQTGGGYRIAYRNGIQWSIVPNVSTGEIAYNATNGYYHSFKIGTTEGMRMFSSTRNVLIQNGGTYTDAGYRLDVIGDTRISGKTTTTNLQVTSGATTGYVLTSDVSGNATWQVPTVTADTFTTGFTYSNNTFTITRNQGQPNLTATINSVTGLTVNGILSATTISASTISAPGSTTQVIYNNGGVLSADTGFVYSGGNIGIGTTTPLAKLDVSSNGGRLRLTQNTAGNVFNGIDFVSYVGGITGSLISNQFTGELRLFTPSTYFPTFYSSGNEIMRISTSGNVGIGTTAPRERLDVSGSTIISSGLSASTVTITTQPTSGYTSTQILMRNSTSGQVEITDSTSPAIYNYGMSYAMATFNYLT